MWNRRVTVWSNIIAELRRKCKLEVCALLAYYAASNSNLLPTYRDNLSVPSSGFGNSRKELSLNVGKKLYLYSLRNNAEERRSHLLRGGSLKSREGKPVPCPRVKDIKGEQRYTATNSYPQPQPPYRRGRNTRTHRQGDRVGARVNLDVSEKKNLSLILTIYCNKICVSLQRRSWAR